jgi:uncharacterized protein involved in type VI secretion and phage assembly
MKSVAQIEMGKLHFPTLGIVTSIFPHASDSDNDNYECNVRIKNTDVELRKVPITTQCIGLAGIPRVGDLVLLIFMNGDINAPIAVGRLYNDEDRPPVNNAEEIVYIPPYDANSQARRIYLEFPSGITLKITDDEVNIKAGDTKVIVLRDGDVVIQSKANINVSAEGDATIKSQGSMTIKGSNITMESDQDMTLKSGTDLKLNSGASAELTSSTQMNVEASATMTIKGQIVNIN